MIIPLLVQAAALSCECPRVYLLTGKWIIRSNHKVSRLALYAPDGPLPLVDGMVVDGDGCYQVKVMEAANEKFSVDAEEQK